MSEVVTMERLAAIQPEELTREKLEQMKRKATVDAPTRRVIAGYVAELVEQTSKLRSAEKVQASCLVMGALQWVLSRFESAAASLKEVKRDELARELEAECCLEAGLYKDALKLYTKLAEKTPCAVFDLAKVDCLQHLGKLDEAAELLKSFGKTYEREAEYHYQSGMVSDLRGDTDAAVTACERALAIDGEHVKSLFRLAYLADLRGDDDAALRLYEQCAAVKPSHVNVLLNLGVLYEDMGRYEDAAQCFERVLQWNPNHERAKLFLADAEASVTMYYDEELERKVDRQNKVLDIPVTDFELSVRSRNCLERMNVKTLGDLTGVTEPALLSYKNFGETSLTEIKSMMASKGLRLGQALEKETPRPATTTASTTPRTESVGLAGKPVTDLELSVRSRKCMQRLGIVSVGQLCEKSEEQLLGCKNFGQTSLTEIKQKLANLGLKLRDSN